MLLRTQLSTTRAYNPNSGRCALCSDAPPGTPCPTLENRVPVCSTFLLELCGGHRHARAHLWTKGGVVHDANCQVHGRQAQVRDQAVALGAARGFVRVYLDPRLAFGVVLRKEARPQPEGATF